ncbi:hypothetical protein ACP26L_36315 (plasmid) [Paenibacillus sp. S-38]|uniref:hypothetical protein n=1 Tax=Paenibacillus sp. S-38 TaxID=3416710 RepID=UPI003CF67C88
MNASLVQGRENPNHPDSPGSPNRPRGENREEGYADPILGDPGTGKIGRWQTIKLDALETVIDQMIEQYLRDKSWYASIRCREALWNMYRRLEWWVKQQVDPNRSDYQRALLMIQDCIRRILEEAQDPELSHNISLPLCPAPYYFPFNASYFNHFDGKDVERTLFDMASLPKSDDFPGMFRYVSSVEDQEWELVHGTAADELQGSENIMKLTLDRLLPSNSSKITFNWRFKRNGYISFKYWSGAAPGNGLNFFINNNQVGGEWSRGTGWQEVRFNVSPGQTYKFDWFVRKQTEERFGKNAVYVKDIKCIEVIKSLGGETPPDYDTMGSEAYDVPGFDWITYSSQSVVRTHFNGVVMDDARQRTFVYHLDNECDGNVSFAYRMGVAQPILESENYFMFQDNLRDRSQQGRGKRGSSVLATHDQVWNLDGKSSSTQGNMARINYELNVGNGCTLDAQGTVQMVCPPLEIDHYVPTIVGTTERNWTWSGTNAWKLGGTAGDRNLRLDNPTKGAGSIATSVTLPDDGWFTFSFENRLRPSETLQARVDGVIVFESRGTNSNNAKIPLKKGTHTIAFVVVDTYTEEGISGIVSRNFAYGRRTESVYGPFGSNFSLNRDWSMTNAGTYSSTNNQEIRYSVFLQPGASLALSEKLRLSPPVENVTASLKFAEDFNKMGGVHDPKITKSSNWQWEDLALRFNPNYNPAVVNDGVMKVENKNGSHNTMTLAGVDMDYDGFVYFEYGGSFGPYENLELFIDGNRVWADAKSTLADEDNKIRVPVSKGSHVYAWVYRDLGGSAYLPPSAGDDGTGGVVIDSGESCSGSGSASHPVPYDQAEWSATTPRNTKFRTGGSHFYTSETMQVIERDGATITRNIWTPSYGNTDFYEKLTLRAGIGVTEPPSVGSVTPSFQTYIPSVGGTYKGRDGSDSYYAFDSRTIPDGFEQGWITDGFHTEGYMEISFRYLAYMVDSTGMRIKGGVNTAGLDGNHRGQFSVYLVPIGEKPGITNRKFQYVENVGKRQNVSKIESWDGSQEFTIKENVPAGGYYLCFAYTDILPDGDKDAQGYPYYAAFKDVRISAAQKPVFNTTTYDKTQVKVELVKSSTGEVVSSSIYSAAANGVGNFNVSFLDLKPNTDYQIVYTLLRGESYQGGTYGRGGTVEVYDGKFYESWGSYCKDKDGNYYLKGSSPYKPPATTNPIPVPPDDSYCWLDSIRLYEVRREVCPGTGVQVTIKQGDSILSNETYAEPGEQLLSAFVENNTGSTQRYEIIMKNLVGCTGDTASLYEGSFVLTDKQPPPPAYALIYDLKIVSNKPIWMGGCYNSKIHVRVLDDLGREMSHTVLASEGLHTFNVSKLPHSPYSKYKIQIETEQRGVTSGVTGKQYLTTFKLIDFKVFENWKFIPDRFNGKLEFFIDNTLIDTYTGPGGFFTKSYSVPKGPHEFKWVFTELGNGFSWDYCDIDFLELTNWVCDRVRVTPYCEKGGGDKCIEELIKCLLRMWRNRPKACSIGKKIWLFT